MFEVTATINIPPVTVVHAGASATNVIILIVSALVALPAAPGQNDAVLLTSLILMDTMISFAGFATLPQ